MAGEEAIFAPTPPLESLRIVLSHAVTSFAGEPAKVFDPESPERSQVIALDISKAYFNAVTPEDEPTYVELPPEFGAKPGTCALLRRHMYGTRRAADGWQSEYLSALRDTGFSQGSASACVFRHVGKHIVLSVHGDDFTASGPASSLDWFEKAMRSRYDSHVEDVSGLVLETLKNCAYLTGSYAGRLKELSMKQTPGKLRHSCRKLN